MNKNVSTNQYISAVLGIAVIAILITTMAVPIANDAAQQSQTKIIGVNDTGYTTRMSLVDDAIIIYGSETGEVSISTGDRQYTYDATQNKLICYFHSDACWLEEDRYSPEYGTPVTSFIAGTNNILLAGLNWTLVYDGVTIKLTYGDDNAVVEVPKGEYNYIYDPEGDYNYTSYFAINQVKISDDARAVSLVMRGWWGISYNTMPFTKSDIKNGVVAFSNSQGNPSIVTNGHLFLNVTDNGDGTYSLGPTAIFKDENGNEVNVTNLGVIAPREYTYYTENSTSSLIGILPLILVVGLLVFAVNAVRLKLE